MSQTEGLDIVGVEAWLTANVPTLVAPFEWKQLVGGHSNLTFEVRDAHGRRAVARRPPLGRLRPRAHDMTREFRIVSALWPTPVPVPEPLALCEDESVTGARFYVMGFVDGRSLSSSADVDNLLPDPDLHRKAAESYFDTIAALHNLDPDDIGLGDLARRDDFVGRQLTSWYRSWTESAEDAEYDDPRLHEMHALLSARKPTSGPARLVHGDIGLHNCLVNEKAEVVAVLDWEVCTLGDARFDVAYALARWSVDGAVVPGREDATLPGSFPSAEEMLARYEERTGGPVDDLDYFVALNRWRWACVAQGVYARYRRGQKSSEGVDLPALRRLIASRLDSAAEACAALAGSAV